MERKCIDFHTHSTASDGSHPPADLIRLADEAELAAVALTDHDTVEGLAPAADAAEGYRHLRFVPGVELSARFSTGTMHMLGLCINPQSPRLLEVTKWLRDARNRRNPQILNKLSEIDLPVTMEEVIAAARGEQGGAEDSQIISRIHIAEAMRRRGYVESVEKAFQRYISPGGPAWVDKDRLEPAETIEVIHDAGGLAVLAHPVQLNCQTDRQVRELIERLAGDGLDGIEVWHSDHDKRLSKYYESIAEEFNLSMAGGSDFHGAVKPGVRLGYPRVTLDQVSGRLAEYISA